MDINKRFLLIINLIPFSLFCASLELKEVIDAAQAVVVVSVADLTTKPMGVLEGSPDATLIHEAFGVSPEKGPNSCARVHQLLFNEKVKIVSKYKNEVECELCNVFYEGPNKTKINKFWTLEKNIRFLNSCNCLDGIPNSYFNNGHIDHKDLISLMLPWFEPNSKITYSVGTRFVRSADADIEEHIAVKIPDHINDKIAVGFIPKNHVLLDLPMNPQESQKLFVSILKKWAADEKFIPYIWGGCSFVDFFDDNINKSSLVDNGTVVFWIRESKIRPFSGFDCSGLILRAAQISGMPYFFKNTTTLANNLRKLKETDILEDGDLIFFPGHVMVITDIEKSEIIEARGYSSGYGKVHMQPINKIFQNINNFKELLNVYFSKTPVKLLDINDKVIKEISEITILKLSSIYE